MNVVVAVPWRPTPERLAAQAIVCGWWAGRFPDCPLILVDTPHQRYNLSAVRNECVRRAEAMGADVVVITDADAILTSTEPLTYAIRDAADGRLHLPYTRQRYLTETETRSVLDGRAGDVPRDGAPGNGAIYVVTPAGYWQAGGSDERFSGWGGDDDGLVAAAQTLTGVVRHDGTVWSLWHADERRPVGTPEHRPNARLAARYWDAVGRPDRMRALIAERDYPGAIVGAVS